MQNKKKRFKNVDIVILDYSNLDMDIYIQILNYRINLIYLSDIFSF